MSDLFGNHIVGFPTRRLISCWLLSPDHDCHLLDLIASIADFLSPLSMIALKGLNFYLFILQQALYLLTAVNLLPLHHVWYRLFMFSFEISEGNSWKYCSDSFSDLVSILCIMLG